MIYISLHYQCMTFIPAVICRYIYVYIYIYIYIYIDRQSKCVTVKQIRLRLFFFVGLKKSWVVAGKFYIVVCVQQQFFVKPPLCCMLRFLTSLVVSFWLAASTALPVCDNVTPKLSCGLSYTDETSCATAGCCWDASPDAIHPCSAPAINGYLYTEQQNSPGLRSGTLALSAESGIFGGGDFATLDLTVTQETTARTHIKIVPPASTQWEIPESLLPRPGGNYAGSDALSSVQITEDPSQPMEIVISRVDETTATTENIFMFSKMMVFQEQYLQYVLEVPSGKLLRDE
jgi:hypothetical protein